MDAGRQRRRREIEVASREDVGSNPRPPSSTRRRVQYLGGDWQWLRQYTSGSSGEAQRGGRLSGAAPSGTQRDCGLNGRVKGAPGRGRARRVRSGHSGVRGAHRLRESARGATGIRILGGQRRVRGELTCIQVVSDLWVGVANFWSGG